MLIPAPMYDAKDFDNKGKSLGIKIKKDGNGKPLPPTADQV